MQRLYRAFKGAVEKIHLPAVVQRNLGLRMGLTIMLAGSVVIFFVFLFVSLHVRTAIFNQRIDQILSNTSVHIEQARTTFNEANIYNAEQAQDLSYKVLYDIKKSSSGAGVVSVFLLHSRSAENQNYYINEISNQEYRSVISSQLQKEVRNSRALKWQSVALKSNTYNLSPGVVVGAKVALPIVGEEELYIIYTLEPEEQNIALFLHIGAIGFLVLLISLGGISFYVTYRVLRPVRETAYVTKKLSQGDLNERVVIKGHDELAQLGTSFNKMADHLQAQIIQLSELSKLQQRFVSDVSHELRTPMTTIRMAGDMLYESKDELEPLLRRSVELLHTQIDRFDAMLSDLLEISRYDANSVKLNTEETDISKLVAKTVEITEPVAQKLNVPVSVSYPQDSPTLEIDSIRVERILRNLLLNAYEHADGTCVEVTVASNTDTVCIRVQDHGVGMSTEVIKHVFDRFYRGDPSRKRTTGGTGLGLAISLEDARTHNGDILVWSKLGAGSSFMLVLPNRDDADISNLALQVIEGQEGQGVVVQASTSSELSTETKHLSPEIINHLRTLQSNYEDYQKHVLEFCGQDRIVYKYGDQVVEGAIDTEENQG